MISTNDLIVFFLGRSTTFPGPRVHGPPIVATNLVLIPIYVNKLIATWNAAPVARFYLCSRRTKCESAYNSSIALINFSSHSTIGK